MPDLESRVTNLEKQLSAFSLELMLALRYIQPDAASSLTKSRIVMEKLLIQVYTVEMGQEPRKPLLGDMLVDNQFTRKIERRILSRMNAIRDMGNLGPHGEAVEPNDAARVLDDLCEVLEWYLRRYAGSTPTLSVSPNSAPPAIAAISGVRESSGHAAEHPVRVEETSAQDIVSGKPHFCLYCGDDSRFELYPYPSFGSLGVADGAICFIPEGSAYFPDTGEKPKVIRWPKNMLLSLSLYFHKVDFDHLYSEYGPEVEELSDTAGMRDFNVPLPTLRIDAIDPSGVLSEGIRLSFAFGTVYRARSFATKAADSLKIKFDPTIREST